LTPSLVEALQIVPQASTSARAAKKEAANAPKPDQLPLQVRLPRQEVRAIKIAAAEEELTVSDFMLACFHAYMKSGKHG
jgi:predicted DNA binding CopG/RHH family protein